nr:PREDICTED: uncharacterized protein LOC106489825 [Apteryx mantelli mantelli]
MAQCQNEKTALQDSTQHERKHLEPLQPAVTLLRVENQVSTAPREQNCSWVHGEIREKEAAIRSAVKQSPSFSKAPQLAPYTLGCCNVERNNELWRQVALMMHIKHGAFSNWYQLRLPALRELAGPGLRFCSCRREALLCMAPLGRGGDGPCPCAPGPLSAGMRGRREEVPVYLPFLLVGSVFVAFVVCGICVGICCCKRLKAQDEEQQSALAPGQTWLLEPDLPSRLATSSSATRSSLGSGPQTSNICTNLAPSLPVTGFTEDALYLSALPASGRLLHPSCTGHGIPTAHTTGTPASFLKRPVYGHSANASPISVAREDQKMYLGVLRV